MLNTYPINPLQVSPIKPALATAPVVKATNSWISLSQEFKDKEYYIIQLKNKDFVLGRFEQEVKQFIFTDLDETEHLIDMKNIDKVKHVLTSDI